MGSRWRPGAGGILAVALLIEGDDGYRLSGAACCGHGQHFGEVVDSDSRSL